MLASRRLSCSDPDGSNNKDLLLAAPSRTFLIFLRMLAAWILFQAWMLYSSPAVFNQLMWYNINLSPGQWALVGWNWLSLLAAEVYLVSCAVSWGRFYLGAQTASRGRRVLRAAAALLCLALSFLYLFILQFAWNAGAAKGSFPTASEMDFGALIADWATWRQWIQVSDLAILQYSILMATAAFAFYFIAAPKWPDLVRSARIGGCLIVLLVTDAVFSRSIGATLEPTQAAHFRVIGSHFLGPQLSLFGRRLFYPEDDPYSPLSVAQLQLRPAYTIEDYRTQARAANAPKRNILVFVVEGLRYDVLARAGGDAQVLPTINALAANGISFERAYANSPETKYAMATIISGLHPLKREVRDQHHDLNYPLGRIYDLLAVAGYRTSYLTTELPSSRKLSASELLDLHSDPSTESLTPSEGALDQPITYSETMQLGRFDRTNISRLQAWITERNAESQPFFSLVYLSSPHLPYAPPDPETSLYPLESLLLPDSALISFFNYAPELTPVMLKRYWNALNFTDRLIGDVLSHLERLRLLDNSTIIVTGDHGELFNEHDAVGHGGRLHEPAIRVPLIISGGSNEAAEVQTELPVSHLDLAPTILDLAGLPPFDGFQGRSLFGPDPAVDDTPVYLTVQAAVFEDGVIAYPYKFVLDRRSHFERMFDLSADPNEQSNIIDAQPAVAAQLRALLQRFRDRQFSYYYLPPSARLNYFPPSIRTPELQGASTPLSRPE